MWWRWWCQRELYVTTATKTTTLLVVKAAAVSWPSKQSYYWWSRVWEELPWAAANSGYDIERITTMNKIDWANHFKFNFPIGIHFCTAITNSNHTCSHTNTLIHAHNQIITRTNWRISARRKEQTNESKLFILIPADE